MTVMASDNHAVELAKRALAHLNAGTTDQAPSAMALDVAGYLDPVRFAREFEAIFLNHPVGLALSVELPEPGSYLARTMLTKPRLSECLPASWRASLQGRSGQGDALRLPLSQLDLRRAGKACRHVRQG
jgi:hypothetical protein